MFACSDFVLVLLEQIRQLCQDFLKYSFPQIFWKIKLRLKEVHIASKSNIAQTPSWHLLYFFPEQFNVLGSWVKFTFCNWHKHVVVILYTNCSIFNVQIYLPFVHLFFLNKYFSIAILSRHSRLLSQETVLNKNK